MWWFSPAQHFTKAVPSSHLMNHNGRPFSLLFDPPLSSVPLLFHLHNFAPCYSIHIAISVQHSSTRPI